MHRRRGDVGRRAGPAQGQGRKTAGASNSGLATAMMTTSASSPSPLAGKIADEPGDRLPPSHANKAGRPSDGAASKPVLFSATRRTRSTPLRSRTLRSVATCSTSLPSERTHCGRAACKGSISRLRARHLRSDCGRLSASQAHLLAPQEYICNIWTAESEKFSLDPSHQLPGLNTQSFSCIALTLSADVEASGVSCSPAARTFSPTDTSSVNMRFSFRGAALEDNLEWHDLSPL